jgi:hypothetical protein
MDWERATPSLVGSGIGLDAFDEVVSQVKSR